MSNLINSELITDLNYQEAVDVADECFPSEWAHSRVREDFKKLAAGKVKFFDEELQQEVNLLEYYLHKVSGNVIGLSGLYNYSANSKECWLGWFCIKPDIQSKGYGTIVLKHILDRASKLGMGKIFLHTEKNNEVARCFYEKNGFNLSAEVEYWSRDLVRYELELSTTQQCA